MYKISRRGIEELIKSEGLKLKIYKDPIGLLTIGIGHLLTQSEIFSGKHALPDGTILDFRQGITKEQALQLMRQDLEYCRNIINAKVTVPLKQHQYDALAHFVYNIGVGAFARSTLLKLLNKGEYEAVPKQIKRWVKQKILVKRREREIAMWNGELHEIAGDPLKIRVNPEHEARPTVLDIKPLDTLDLMKVPETEVLKIAEQLGLI